MSTAMRYTDPRITPSMLEQAIKDYEKHYSELIEYGVHLRWWIARYSRGDSLEALVDAFAVVADKVEATGKLERSRFGSEYRPFGYKPTDIGRFRTALVLLSIELCLRVPEAQVRKVLDCCERGDPILETIARAALPADKSQATRLPAFAREFDGLYSALAATSEERPRIIAEYLDVWLDIRMEGFGFKVGESKLGYWCFEAAGVVAALDIDDTIFAEQPHYPRDLVAFYRSGRSGAN